MKRLKDQSGFTLAETLLAVLILLLVSVIVATGMPAAKSAYEKVVIGANAQAMLSNAVTSLRDELGTAWRVKLTDGKKAIEYFNANTGAKSKIMLDSTGDYPAIALQDYIPLNNPDDLIHSSDATQGDSRHLVPDYNSRLYVAYESIDIDTDKQIVKVEGLKVCKKTDSIPLFELVDDSGRKIYLEIHLLSESTE